jgi:hypothetical protein
MVNWLEQLDGRAEVDVIDTLHARHAACAYSM